MLSRYSSRSFESVRAVEIQVGVLSEEGLKALKSSELSVFRKPRPSTPFHDIDLEMEK